jgi:hypothetical protein
MNRQIDANSELSRVGGRLYSPRTHARTENRGEDEARDAGSWWLYPRVRCRHVLRGTAAHTHTPTLMRARAADTYKMEQLDTATVTNFARNARVTAGGLVSKYEYNGHSPRFMKLFRFHCARCGAQGA